MYGWVGRAVLTVLFVFVHSRYSKTTIRGEFICTAVGSLIKLPSYIHIHPTLHPPTGPLLQFAQTNARYRATPCSQPQLRHLLLENLPCLGPKVLHDRCRREHVFN